MANTQQQALIEQLEAAYQQISAYEQQVNSEPLVLAQLPLESHPEFPNHDRFARVYKVETSVKSAITPTLTVIKYAQVLKHKNTGKEAASVLKCPEWNIYESETSSLRDEQFQRLYRPMKDAESGEFLFEEDGVTPKKESVLVNTHQYMLWLLKNNKAGFLQLMQMYLQEFVSQNLDALNELA